jgi:hypothetical protein
LVRSLGCPPDASRVMAENFDEAPLLLCQRSLRTAGL